VGPDLVVDLAFVNRKPADQSEDRYLANAEAVHSQLFDLCARQGIPVLLTSSSAVYGEGSPGESLREHHPRQPISLYGRAKAQQEVLAERAQRETGLKLCIARLFNLLGPGNGMGTVAHDWVSQLAANVPDESCVLTVNNRQTSRDFVDPRDAAVALSLLASRLIEDHGTPYEVFNVASGHSLSLRRLERLLKSLCPVPYRLIETQPILPSFDARVQCGDSSAIRQATGWEPLIDWERSVRDIWKQYVNAAVEGSAGDR
jgi:nucleoside-diphosphate-sugar epimerase